MLSEPDVALTDWGLAVESGLFAWLMPRQAAAPAVRGWLTVFFASIAVGAATGGLVHGLFSDGNGILAGALWRAALLAIGVTALSAWALGATLLWPASVVRAALVFGTGALVIYGGVVTVVAPVFAAAVTAYAPAAVFLLVALLVHWLRSGDAHVPVAVGGLVVLLAGSGLQWAEVAVHPVYLTHNALFHVIEAVALALLFAGTRTLAPQVTRGRAWPA